MSDQILELQEDDVLLEDNEEIVSPIKRISSLKIEKGLRWVIIAALIILGGELIMILVVNPCLPFSKVEVVGMPELDKRMILEKAGITNRSSYVSVNAQNVEKRLRNIAAVRTVHVTKRFPDSLRITLEGRKPIAMSFGSIDGRMFPVFYDKQGQIFMIGSEGKDFTAHRHIPIISGFPLNEPYLGMQLPSSINSLLYDLEAIRLSSPELLAAVSEIQLNRTGFDSYELILYPVHNKVRIRLGTEITEDMLRYMLLVVDVCVSRGVKVEEIDFRTGTASYTIKEATSG